ncbi:DUF445 domain-containing protein [Alkalihalobacillus pseudalcaliphilus]|uniref:DUF445 domain-containing protein n=1 Tax=Alkalihalobacillus pseudalcaliphilus TaxID=79884 RepID=UPI00064DCECF|nr:DUF445 family protein [Alkalihalobacillus pseudalcaliphilus]KMK75671.1 hypothetical protein AB990_10325 [Alkalihalobacillus pseudalcaliphilus]
MNSVVTIFIMVIIGALIGGLTNLLAIRMLFRPYKEIKVGKVTMPFTPGLIPKRQDEISKQLGKTVSNYLLTSEGIQEKVRSESFSEGITTWLEEEVDKLTTNEETLAQLIEKHFLLQNPKEILQQKLKIQVEKEYDLFFEKRTTDDLGKVIPDQMHAYIENSIPRLTLWIQESLDKRLSSKEGREQLNETFEHYLMRKGTLGNVLQRFVGHERIVDKLQPQLSKILQDKQTTVLIEGVLRKEWIKLQKKSMTELQSFISKEQIISELPPILERKVPIINWLDKPVSVIIRPYTDSLKLVTIPKIVDFLIKHLDQYIPMIVKRLNIEEIVQKQIERFPLEQLEELIISIAKRELTMITLLGGFLGALIGLFQGLMVIFLF